MEPGKTVYVSITGLELKSWRHIFRFGWHTMRSFQQAKKAEGNISAALNSINRVKHTRTVWENEAAMRAFAYSGAHRKAIAAFPAIATGKTFGYETEAVPDWDEVHDLWRKRGKDYNRQA